MLKKIIIFLLLIFLGVGASAHAEEEWKEYRARHFYIYYKDAPEGFLENVKESAENYYEEITRNLGFTRYEGWSYEDRAKIYIYRDQDDYINSSKQEGWSHGAAYARIKVIRTFPSAHGFFDSTLPHELGHIIFREFVGYYTELPLWIDEGVAMYQEKAKRWGANQYVKKAMEEGTFLSLSELSKMRLRKGISRDDVDLFYAESASVVYFMISELGEYRFVRFCKSLQGGKTFQQALKYAYTRFKDIDDLNRAWINYLKKQ